MSLSAEAEETLTALAESQGPTRTDVIRTAIQAMEPARDPDGRDIVAWIFYATPARSERRWRSQLRPGRIEFWQHGLGVYKVGGASYSRMMQRGDTVLLVAGAELIGTAVLAADASFKFVDSDNARWWPLLVMEVYSRPLPRDPIEREIGRKLTTNEGAVHPVRSSWLPPINRRLGSLPDKAQELPFAREYARRAIENGEAIADALVRNPDLEPDQATRNQLGSSVPLQNNFGPEPDDRSVALEPVDALPSVFNDRHDATDLIQIDGEVTAFARLAISRGIDPPLSVGVFGDWGSGKSFFMEKVQRKIEALTKPAEGTDQAAVEADLHGDVAQIRFNAWHYIETNLWASLVGSIFADLDRWLKKEAPAEDVDALFDQLSTSRQLKLEAYRALFAAQAEAARARAEVAEAQARRREAVRTPLSDVEIWKATAAAFLETLQPEEKEDLRKIATSIGAPDAEDAATEAAQLVRDTARQAFRGRLILDSIVAQAGAFRGALAIVGVLFGPSLLVLGWALFVPSTTAGAVRGVMLSAAASLSGLTALGAKAFRRAKTQLERLDGLRGKLEAAFLEKSREEREAEAKAITDAAAAQQAVAEAERKAAEASDRVLTLQREQDGQTATGRLNRFIREKVTGGEYARHLGIVANIHKDFSQLSDLLQAQADDRDKSAEDARTRARESYLAAAEVLIEQAERDGVDLTENQLKDLREHGYVDRQPPALGRIVLYIDDLDRCPPSKVVDVLQAIHMLLFFRLFVVFVAVDARWLKRSLRVQFPDLIADRSRDTAGEAEPDGVKPADAQDYLEKIFQIPFWVSPMDPEQGRGFVMGLTDELLEAPPREDLGPDDDADLDPGPYDEEVDLDESASADDAFATTGGGEGGARPESIEKIRLTGDEQAALAAFGARLGGSPRRTKRYVNTYVLIKIRQLRSGGLASAVWPTAAMLAVVVGAREAAADFFRAAEGLPSGADLPALAAALEPGRTRPDGDRLAIVLETMTRYPESYDLEALRRLGPVVRRYAF